MTDRTPGGLFMPDNEAIAMVRNAENRPCTEPMAQGGMLTIDAGWASPFFVTDPGAFVADLYDARVLVSRVAIEKPDPLIPILEAAARAAVPLFIVAPALSIEAIAFLVVNQLRGIVYVNAVIANATLGVTAHDDIASLALADLPRANRVVSGKTKTVIGMQ